MYTIFVGIFGGLLVMAAIKLDIEPASLASIWLVVLVCTFLFEVITRKPARKTTRFEREQYKQAQIDKEMRSSEAEIFWWHMEQSPGSIEDEVRMYTNRGDKPPHWVKNRPADKVAHDANTPKDNRVFPDYWYDGKEHEYQMVGTSSSQNPDPRYQVHEQPTSAAYQINSKYFGGDGWDN